MLYDFLRVHPLSLLFNLPQQSPNNRPSWIVSCASFQAFRLGTGKYGVKTPIADESFRLTEEAFGLSGVYFAFTGKGGRKAKVIKGQIRMRVTLTDSQRSLPGRFVPRLAVRKRPGVRFPKVK